MDLDAKTADGRIFFFRDALNYDNALRLSFSSKGYFTNRSNLYRRFRPQLTTPFPPL